MYHTQMGLEFTVQWSRYFKYISSSTLSFLYMHKPRICNIGLAMQYAHTIFCNHLLWSTTWRKSLIFCHLDLLLWNLHVRVIQDIENCNKYFHICGVLKCFHMWINRNPLPVPFCWVLFINVCISWHLWNTANLEDQPVYLTKKECEEECLRWHLATPFCRSSALHRSSLKGIKWKQKQSHCLQSNKT